MFTIISTTRLLITLLFTISFCIPFFWMILCSRKFRIQRFLPFTVHWSKLSMKILSMKHVINGKDNIPLKKNGYLSISNHQSYLDILLIHATLVCVFLMKSNQLKTPFGWSGLVIGGVLINLKKKNTHIAIAKKVLDISKNLVATHIFPEGTRSIDGKILKFKKGTLLLAYKNNVAILPSGIWGTHLQLKKNSVKYDSRYTSIYSIGKIIKPENFDDAFQFIRAVEKEVHNQVDICKKDFIKLNKFNS